MFGKRALERALASAHALISDQRQEIADLREEKRELLNRIMALTNVGALREFSRQLPSEEATPPRSPESVVRLHRFPGNDPMKPPSRPPTPPTPRMPFTPDEDKPDSDEEAS